MKSTLIFVTLASAATLRRRLTDSSKPSGSVASDTIANCTYWINTDAGDTCKDIVDYFGISQSNLIKYNPSLRSDCSGLVTGRSYCVEVNYGLKPTTTAGSTSSPSPTANQPQQSGITTACQRYYKVKSGDSCQGIVDTYKAFSLAQFYSWNPAVGNECKNLQTGYYVCVGISSTPTNPTTTSAAAVVTPTPNIGGAVSTCNKFDKSRGTGLCQGFADRNGISIAQLYAWNPALGYKGENCQSKFLVDYYYCMAVTGPKPPGGPVQSGVIDTCAWYHKAETGDTCATLASRARISTRQLYAWNSVLGKNGESCNTALWADTWYCTHVAGDTTVAEPSTPTSTAASVPTPNIGGTVSTCSKFDKSRGTGLCQGFADRNQISTAQLYAWNPNLGYKGENCSSKFIIDYYYCMAVTGPKPPGGPVQSGVIDTCAWYHKAQSGDTCSTLASRARISTQQLYAWNSVLGRNGEYCNTKLWADTWYCTNVAGDTSV